MPVDQTRRWSPLAIGAVIGVVLLTIAAVTILARRPGGGSGLTIGRTSQVTRDPGLEVDPGLSPDGASLAYAAGPTSAMQIYVRQVSGGRVVQLTNDPKSNFRWPKWSPDGSQIAYEGDDGVFVVPALGGVSRRIIRVDPQAVRVVGASALSGLDWAPDGKRIVWASAYMHDRLVVTDLATGDSTMMPLPLGGAFSPAWSPDGRTVAVANGNPIFVFGTAYFANVGTASIWLVPMDGGRPTQVTSDSALNVSPQWSPDGRTLFWVSDRDGSRDIYQWRVGAAGTPQRLTTGTDAHGISVSRTSGRLAYSRLSSRSSIWSIPVSSRSPLSIRQATQITTGNETIGDLDLSPDGKWLVFDSDRGGNPDVYVMPAAGGEARALTSDPAGDFSPDWSPDGRTIAFHSLRDGNRNVYVIGADGTGLRRLTSGPEEELDPDWAADGTTLLFQSFTSTTSVLRSVSTTAGAKPEMLADVPGDFAHWAPQGRDFFYHALDGLHLHRADRSPDTLLISNAAEGGEVSYGAYAPDGKEIYYLVRSASEWRIRSASLAGGPHRELVDFDDPARQHGYYGFCTDGRLFYFTIGSLESDIWIADLERR